MYFDIILALINCLLCFWRAIANIRSGRLISVAWFLIAYFALFFLPVAMTKEMSWYRGFRAEYVKVGDATIHKVIIYVLIFNIIFAVAEMIISKLLLRQYRLSTARWQLDLPDQNVRILGVMLGLFWLVGGLWYMWQVRNSNYRDYVEGASWAVVFLWASSPLIAIMAMRKNWVLAIVLCLPFLYEAVHLDVRSFALLSLVPMMVIGLFHVKGDEVLLARFWKMFGFMVMGGVLLVGVSIYISQSKTGEFAFPDSRMPFGVVQTVGMVDQTDKHTGFGSLQLYGWNYINPFMRLIGVAKPVITDTPVVIANLLDGVPEGWPVYFHYPALLWSDAYISFGWLGLCLAIFWAFVLCLWEWLMIRNTMILSLLLPFYCWHCYLLVRGAIAIASVPIAYAFYFSLMAYLIAFRIKLFNKAYVQDNNWGEGLAKPTSTSNLMY